MCQKHNEQHIHDDYLYQEHEFQHASLYAKILHTPKRSIAQNFLRDKPTNTTRQKIRGNWP